MQATKRCQYALRAMIFLAKKNKTTIPLRVIAQEENISFDYLEKVFSKLEKEGLVESKRGAGGGYFISKSLNDLTLEDIFNAVEEPIAVVDCINSKCPYNNNCNASKAWTKVNKAVKDSLASIKLSDLIK